MRVLVLLNASAGASASDGTEGTLRQRVQEALARAQIAADVRAVPPQRMTQAAQSAAGAGEFDAVIAAGGDGTINAVAAGLVGSGKPLGVLPLGTMNHFARNLGMPLDLDESAQALAEAKVRAIDVGEVNGVVFINNASIGLYPRVVATREALRRRLVRSKWLAMLLACVSVFRRFPTVRVRISANEHAVLRETPFVFVGNNRYEMDLLNPGERACLDAAELGLYFANRAGRLAMLRLLLRGIVGRLDQAADFEALTLREFDVETGRRRVAVAVDGEVRLLAPPLRFRSRGGALKILAPPGFGATCRAPGLHAA